MSLFLKKSLVGEFFRIKHHLAGTSEDFELCTQVLDDVKFIMLNVVATCKETSMKKRKIVEIIMDGGNPTLEIHITQQIGKRIQSIINQMIRNPLKEEAYDLVEILFYISVIPFNCIKNLAFAKSVIQLRIWIWLQTSYLS